jgi:hypothetical protein
MSAARTLRGATLAGFLALVCLVFGAGNRAIAEVIDCTNGSPGPNMTIVIYNNSSDYNIYPVLFAGAPSATDQWMQACFKVPVDQIQPSDNYPYRGRANTACTSIAAPPAKTALSRAAR